MLGRWVLVVAAYAACSLSHSVVLGKDYWRLQSTNGYVQAGTNGGVGVAAVVWFTDNGMQCAFNRNRNVAPGNVQPLEGLYLTTNLNSTQHRLIVYKPGSSQIVYPARGPVAVFPYPGYDPYATVPSYVTVLGQGSYRYCVRTGTSEYWVLTSQDLSASGASQTSRVNYVSAQTGTVDPTRACASVVWYSDNALQTPIGVSFTPGAASWQVEGADTLGVPTMAQLAAAGPPVNPNQPIEFSINAIRPWHREVDVAVTVGAASQLATWRISQGGTDRDFAANGTAFTFRDVTVGDFTITALKANNVVAFQASSSMPATFQNVDNWNFEQPGNGPPPDVEWFIANTQDWLAQVQNGSNNVAFNNHPKVLVMRLDGGSSAVDASWRDYERVDVHVASGTPFGLFGVYSVGDLVTHVGPDAYAVVHGVPEGTQIWVQAQGVYSAGQRVGTSWSEYVEASSVFQQALGQPLIQFVEGDRWAQTYRLNMPSFDPSLNLSGFAVAGFEFEVEQLGNGVWSLVYSGLGGLLSSFYSGGNYTFVRGDFPPTGSLAITARVRCRVHLNTSPLFKSEWSNWEQIQLGPAVTNWNNGTFDNLLALQEQQRNLFQGVHVQSIQQRVQQEYQTQFLAAMQNNTSGSQRALLSIEELLRRQGEVVNTDSDGDGIGDLSGDWVDGPGNDGSTLVDVEGEQGEDRLQRLMEEKIFFLGERPEVQPFKIPSVFNNLQMNVGSKTVSVSLPDVVATLRLDQMSGSLASPVKNAFEQWVFLLRGACRAMYLVVLVVGCYRVVLTY